MISDDLLIFLWVEVIVTTINSYNHLPHTALNKLTPHEKSTGTKPNIKHFQPFRLK